MQCLCVCGYARVHNSTVWSKMSDTMEWASGTVHSVSKRRVGMGSKGNN